MARKRRSAKARRNIARGIKTYWDKKGRKEDKNSTAKKVSLGVLAAGSVGGLGVLALKNKKKLSNINLGTQQALKNSKVTYLNQKSSQRSLNPGVTTKSKPPAKKSNPSIVSKKPSYTVDKSGQMSLDLGVESTKRKPKKESLAAKPKKGRTGQKQLFRKRRKTDAPGGSDFIATKDALPTSKSPKKPKKVKTTTTTSRKKKGQPIVDMSSAQTPPKTRAERNKRRRNILKSQNVRDARAEVRKVQDLIDKGKGSQEALSLAIRDLKRKKAARKGRVTRAKNRGTYFNMFIGNIEFGRGPDKKKRKRRGSKKGFVNQIKQKVRVGRNRAAESIGKSATIGSLKRARRGKFTPGLANRAKNKLSGVVAADKKRVGKKLERFADKTANDEFKVAKKQARQLNKGVAPKERMAAGVLYDTRKNKVIAAKLERRRG